MGEKRELRTWHPTVCYSDEYDEVQVRSVVKDGPAGSIDRVVTVNMPPKAARELAVELLKKAQQCDEFVERYVERWGHKPSEAGQPSASPATASPSREGSNG